MVELAELDEMLRYIGLKKSSLGLDSGLLWIAMEKRFINFVIDNRKQITNNK